MMNFLHPPSFLLPSLHSSTPLLFLSYLIFHLSLSPPTTQSSLLVWLLCVLAGHTEPLRSNQSQLSVGWKTSQCSRCRPSLTHTQTHTAERTHSRNPHTDPHTYNRHTLLIFTTRPQKRGFLTDLPTAAIRHCATLAKDHGRCGFCGDAIQTRRAESRSAEEVNSV